MRPYGMPHLGAFYTRDDVHAYRREDGAYCAICGRRSDNAHHEPPLGMGGVSRGFVLEAPLGKFSLKPALIAVCGFGNADGCHRDIHSGLWRIDWRFDDAEGERQWLSGELLAHGWVPHDERLFEIGRYVFENSQDSEKTFEMRGYPC